MSNGLAFDEENHIYTYCDEKVPSVTQVIGEFKPMTIGGEEYLINTLTGGYVPASKFVGPGDFGTAVHQAIQLSLAGTLNMEMVHPEILRTLSKFTKWIALVGADTRDVNKVGSLSVCEKTMYSKKYGYAGTPDIVLSLRGALTLIDVKTGGYGFVGPQTAGYAQLYKENIKNTRLKRMVLLLPKGKAPAKSFYLENKNDWLFFKARLTTMKYLKGR